MPIVEAPTRVCLVVIYLRVSTVDQGKHGFSLPEQRQACQRRAEEIASRIQRESGVTVQLHTMEFCDTVGGDLLARPELDRLRQFIREHHPDYLVCLDPDRFSRSTLQALTVVQEIETAGTQLEFVQHDYKDTAEGHLFFTMRVSFAEYEKVKILERTARGKRGKMRAGQIPHGLMIYGYRYLTAAERAVRARESGVDPGALVPDESEAYWVRQMFDWVIQEHLGSERIAQRLNRLHVPTKRGRTRWWRGVVQEILRNTTYTGQLQLNRYDFTGLGSQQQLPRDRRTKKMTPRTRPSGEWIAVPVPGLVTPEVFDQAQVVLNQMKRWSQSDMDGTRPGRGDHMLSGLAVCGLCEAPMYYAYNKKVNGYYLRCANRSAKSGSHTATRACLQRNQQVAPVEDKIWGKVCEWVLEPNLLVQANQIMNGQTEPDETRIRLKDREDWLTGQIEAAKQEQKRLLVQVAKGTVHSEVADEMLSEMKSRLDGLESQLAEILKRLHRLDHAESSGRQVVRTAEVLHKEFADRLNALSTQERQYVVRMLLREVRLLPGGKVALVMA